VCATLFKAVQCGSCADRFISFHVSTAAGHASLLSTLNGAPDAAVVHASFCAAYLGAQVNDAHVVSVDRSGFTILGRDTTVGDADGDSGSEQHHVHGGDADPGADAVADAQRRQQWREFRFAFSEEVTNREQLLETLRDMAAEAKEHLTGAPEQS